MTTVRLAETDADTYVEVRNRVHRPVRRVNEKLGDIGNLESAHLAGPLL